VIRRLLSAPVELGLGGAYVSGELEARARARDARQ
jgi:hypothetical protein